MGIKIQIIKIKKLLLLIKILTIDLLLTKLINKSLKLFYLLKVLKYSQNFF